MKNYPALIFFAMLIIIVGVNASSLKIITVTGAVTSKDGSVLQGVNVNIKGSSTGTTTDSQGKYSLQADENAKLVFSFIGYKSKEISIKKQTIINVILEEDVQSLQEVVVIGYGKQERRSITGAVTKSTDKKDQISTYSSPKINEEERNHNTEEYDAIHESRYLDVTKNALSTFSIDVDKASYGNIRRFINDGQLPQKDVVRIEEMLNYFTYDYKEPKGDDPFAVNTEIANCPWNKAHQIIQIGLQGKKIPVESLPASNLVFLIDVSGSMDQSNKLPLLKSAYRLLIDQLREKDNVAIVVYAGAAGVVLPSTPGSKKDVIISALDNLHAGGSTAGGEGIELAYKIAKENFKTGGNNRVILATDGDFNVGSSSNADMERLIEEKRENGTYLTVLGFGMGNYKDSKMEILADKGNGNYAYIDNILEAEKVFVKEFGGTLFTIAKDVKIQVEFNPAKVKAYRLIGYENRTLKNEDFNDDKKDAGELGSGHTVTALYEIIPAGSDEKVAGIDELKYQNQQIDPKAYNSKEIMTVKLRYKQPDGDVSKLIEKAVITQNLSEEKTSDNFKFACAVTEFGLVLRDSEFKGKSNLKDVIAMAESAKGKDKEGYRAEFIKLVYACELLGKK